MNAPDVITPLMRPFLPATADFGSGKDSPRQFLERCIVELDTWEPKIGAFVTLNLDAARAAADHSTEGCRTGKPLSPMMACRSASRTLSKPSTCPPRTVRRSY
jgi:Asp-tRNA(Asn)/Glu-tRNA(Gln) amidotransferase A subunit family amidase